MIEPIQNLIVAGVDGSPSADQAAFWAAAEAQRRGAALRLVHAYSVPSMFYGPGARPEAVNRAGRYAAAAVLDRTELSIRQAYPGLEVTRVSREASAVDALRAESEHAALTVVGSHGSHQLAEALLGSVAARISGHAHSPVVVIRSDPALKIGHPGQGDGPIVVGMDGSPDSDDALAFALEAAAIRRTFVVAIRTWDDMALRGSERLYPPIVDCEQTDQHEQQLLADQLLPWTEKFPEVSVRPLVLRGRPAPALLRYCLHLDSGGPPSLLVVGSRGRGGVAGMLLGSTSNALIAGSTCTSRSSEPVPDRDLRRSVQIDLKAGVIPMSTTDGEFSRGSDRRRSGQFEAVDRRSLNGPDGPAHQPRTGTSTNVSGRRGI